MHRTCATCLGDIPAGQAVLRSVDFELVAWCRDCATGNPPAIPAQRSALGVRLAAARASVADERIAS